MIMHRETLLTNNLSVRLISAYHAREYSGRRTVDQIVLASYALTSSFLFRTLTVVNLVYPGNEVEQW